MGTSQKMEDRESMDNLHADILTNVASIKNRITEYELKYNRPPGSVKLLASSKGQSIERIETAFAGGVVIFGENYVQEALKKMALTNKPIEWHFIGHIQSNKTKKIAEHFDWVQSIDCPKIAKRLNDHRPKDKPPINACIEVNVSHEATKFGVDVDLKKVLALANYCRSLPNLKLRGLMTIPAHYEDYEHQRQEFDKLYAIWQHLKNNGFDFDVLSMGMSADFEVAIAEKSTMVRIGTAIFGQR